MTQEAAQIPNKPFFAELPTRKKDDLDEDARLRLTEIFYSLQGEGRFAGDPTIFVRLTGCPLRCVYCDSEYAFFGGQWLSFDDIFTALSNYQCKTICVTGGEPLAQPNCINLLDALCKRGFNVSLETSGAMDISVVNRSVSRVLDIKTPESGEVSKNLWSNLDELTQHDQVKFVVCSKADYEWAKEKVINYELHEKCLVLFSPSHHQVTARNLADWILQDQLPVRFQTQLHKIIWQDEPGR